MVHESWVPVLTTMQIALIVNRAKTGASDCASTLQHLAAEAGVAVKTWEDENLPEGFLNGCTAALAVGGDGTILGLVEAAVKAGVPLMGINFGKLGFMATFEAAEAGEGFRKLLAGQCRETTRTLLRVRLAKGAERLALNDVVIRTTSPRLLRLEV
jgi:NAD+ kinase